MDQVANLPAKQRADLFRENWRSPRHGFGRDGERLLGLLGPEKAVCRSGPQGAHRFQRRHKPLEGVRHHRALLGGRGSYPGLATTRVSAKAWKTHSKTSARTLNKTSSISVSMRRPPIYCRANCCRASAQRSVNVRRSPPLSILRIRRQSKSHTPPPFRRHISGPTCDWRSARWHPGFHRRPT